jgi:hypothetical protein
MTILAIILLIVAGVSKAVKDRIMTGWSTSKFKQWGFNREWWDNQISWRNKWKDDGLWVYDKERFPLSSTVLVFITDAWHCFDLIFMLSFAAGIWLSPMNPVLSIILVLGVFQTVYPLLKIKK